MIICLIPYTDEELCFLKQRKHMDREKLCQKFNKKFKKNKSPGAIKQLMQRKGWKTGRTGRFEKGHKPLPNAYPTGPNKTSFKKGSIPLNTKPLWSERITVDGYLEIKVPEKNPHTGCPTRYRQAHIWIWEQVHGKSVPENFVITFIDGDKLNCEPDNLELISRAELCRRNKLNYSNLPSELKPAVRNLAKLQVKIGEMNLKRKDQNCQKKI